MKVEKKEFQSILNTVKPDTNVIFTRNYISSFNESVCILHPFESDITGNIPAKEFQSIISGIKQKEIVLRSTNELLQIKAGKKGKDKLTAQLNMIEDSISSGTIESIIETAKDIKWKKLPGNFKEGIFMTMFSASRDASQPFLTCLYVNGNRIISSDDLRISAYELEKEMKDTFLLPATSAVKLVKFDIKKYAIDESWVYFKDDNDVIFCSRILDDEYPDPTDYFEFEGNEIELTEGIGDLVKTVSVLAEGDFDLDKRIYVKFENGFVKVRAEKDIGWIETEIESSERDNSIEFVINPMFFSEILGRCSSALVGEDRMLFSHENFKHLVALHVE